MPDREKVIYDIERCICHVPDACRDCSHYGHGEVIGCMEELLTDALAMLKEQQGTIRKKQDDIDMLCNEIAKLKHKLHDKWTGTWEWISDDKYRCSECANETYVDECMEEPQYLFCPYCGSKMTFAGRSVK